MKRWGWHSKILLLTAEIAAGVVSSLSLAIVFIKIFLETLEKDTLSFDQQLAGYIYSWRSPGLTKLMMMVTDLGAEYMIIMSILIVIFLIWRKHKTEAFSLVIILVMGIVINFSLKRIIHRPRPIMAPLIVETSYSFPSGHAMNSSVFYLAIAFYFYHLTRKKKLSLWVTAGAIGLIIIIGFSRVYLGVHYPSDVVAGYVVGGWWLSTAILITKSFSWLKLVKAEEKKAVY